MVTTADDVQALHDEIAAKREKLANAQSKGVDNIDTVSYEIQAAELKAELARIDNDLANAGVKITDVREASAGNLQLAKNALAIATGKPVVVEEPVLVAPENPVADQQAAITAPADKTDKAGK